LEAEAWAEIYRLGCNRNDISNPNGTGKLMSLKT
jgi:hypothetical protein